MWKIGSLLVLAFFYGCACADEEREINLNTLCTEQGVYLTSNPNDCKSFILCKYREAKKIECPTDMVCFSESLGVCSKNSTDCNCGILEDDLMKQYCTSKPDSWFLKVAAEDCSMYYICWGAAIDPIRVDCPNGWHYSRAEEECVTPLKAGCQSLSHMCVDKRNGFRFPAVDCSEYYECNAAAVNKPVLKECPTGQYYDGNTLKCIAAEDSTCKNECDDEDVNDLPPPTSATDNPIVTQPPVEKPDCKSSANEGHSFRHEECNKFYVCVNEFPMEMFCQDNFYFNDTLKMCQEDINNQCK